MDLYTLDSNFQKEYSIDEFESLIWTERYTAAGDISLVVPANPITINRLVEGTCLGLFDSKEVMRIDAQMIDNKSMKVTGNSLTKFLNERVAFTANENKLLGIAAGAVGVRVADIVSYMCIDANFLGPGAVAIDGTLNIIPGLSIGDTDNTGPSISLVVPFGPLYDGIQVICENHALGMSLYLDEVVAGVPSFKFKTYRGVDRTSNQVIRPIVRFSPEMNSLTNIKELRSNVGYKTNAYAFAPANPTGPESPPGKGYIPGFEFSSGFDRRVLLVYVDDLTEAQITGDAAALNAILVQRALDALAKHNHTKVVDGEIVSQEGLMFGTDYMLGDVVELQGYSGIVQQARVTEFIRSQDITGESSYPTLSIV